MTTTTPRDWIATYNPDDPALHNAIRQHYKKFMWISVPSFGLTYMFVYLGIDWFEGTGGTASDRLFGAPYWLAVVTFAVALVPIVGSFRFGLRRRRRAVVQRNPRPVLTRAQARRVDRQIAGRLPVAPHEVPFLRDVALAMYAQRWATGVMAGMLLVCLSAGMLGPAVLGWLALVPVAISVISVRAVLQARRFLRSVGVTPV